MDFMTIKVGIIENKNTIENTTLNIVFDITPGPCTEEPTKRLYF
jgi:nitrite reductase/ring-hydroxylating ferredoxin subunit